MLHTMIMAGGGGTRFWPRSRSARPKQFLSFEGDRTLLQATFDRSEALVPPERFWVITSKAHRDQAIEQLPAVAANRIVGEPTGRDTAACIGLGAALIAREDPNATMVVMPADHAIEPVGEFHRALKAAEQLVDENPEALLTFGIPPAYPAIGYGYIQRGTHIAQRQGVNSFEVLKFREKPSAEVAEQYIASGEYYWNSGIFVWKVKTILAELKRLKPGIFESVSRIADAWGTPNQQAVFAEEYSHVEKISIDFAVMENAKKVLVLQAPYQWDDVGSWLALERRNPQDKHGNTVRGLHTGINTSACVIVSDAEHLIATIGVSNLLIIQDGNATLIADRRDEATVKEIVEKLKKTPGLERYL
ncbi:mannose-1-phosphate guanylyltransferase [Zavarzinella formosa]|uniref:mannose-1-phosphate guanylyltransferase n=1 Tax=Zavarzinella formosa TaxID=360055 RepID=UPI0003010654|nr:mannose-1-phosphate guanylyltransferase [Zavarzinella formosa]